MLKTAAAVRTQRLLLTVAMGSRPRVEMVSPQADAVESADLDLSSRSKPAAGTSLRFHAVLRADKANLVAAGAQFAGHREPGDHMSARAAARHQEIVCHLGSRL